MSHLYYFTHSTRPHEKYLAEERSDDETKVYWDESLGHKDAGNTTVYTSSAKRYLEGGSWVLCDAPFSACIPVEDSQVSLTTVEALGMFRPVLETRKTGKVRVELVDDGFPLALREIAKVMTWAQTAKGYKDHDWQNLPDAQVQLAAAASRHRTDQIEQHVVKGLPLLECVDPESKLVHKAHEAFGVLAQLELMLRERAE